MSVVLSPVATMPVASEAARTPKYWWPWVLCLLGLDYFSTLAYQPSLTFEVVGRLGPWATVVVVVVTLFGVLPVYWYVAGRSSAGEGSIGLLEKLVCGWRGKTVVLLLLGFAATDFIMLKTISLADAAAHVIKGEELGWLSGLAQWLAQLSTNCFGPRFAGYFSEQLLVTLLLGILGFVFWFLLRRGFNRNVIVVAAPIVILYLTLNGIIIVSGLVHLVDHPLHTDQWFRHIESGNWAFHAPWWSGAGWISIVLLCLLSLPNLALGLSGFEMSMIVMPQVDASTLAVGAKQQMEETKQRIRNTRKVLVFAVLIMSVFLLSAVWVTTLLIPLEELTPGGRAADRALAYLAHGGRVTAGPDVINPMFGPWFGLLYDLTTVILLCLAGTSVMTALGVLLPQFLFRFGMELKWSHRWGVLLVLFALVNLAVTVWFQASVSAQRGAYATGVLVLITSACLVSYLDQKRAKETGTRWASVGLVWFGIVTGGFVLITVVVLVQAPSGLMIAGAFIGALLIASVIFRAVRANELRTSGVEFKDAQSKLLWDSLRLADFPVLVPHRPGRHERDAKEKQIRREHNLAQDVDIVFIEVELDDPSNFTQNLLVEVFEETNRFVIKVTRCVSVAHAIAYIALEMSRDSKPPGVHFGWSELGSLSASWGYLAFGEGNIPWKVRELIAAAEPNIEKRPRVIVG